MISRGNKNRFTDWWWTLDKVMLVLLLLLLVGGFLLSFSASPAVAKRLGLDPFHFVIRHGIFLFPAILFLLLPSFLNLRYLRRLSVFIFLVSFIMLALLPFIGFSAKGATRWLPIGSFLLQPSEFLKPSFIIVSAWLFAERDRQPDIPCHLFAIILLVLSIALLVIQPDIGQSTLLLLVWGFLFFVSGMSWVWILGLGTSGILGSFLAYSNIPHVRSRLDQFFSGSGQDYQAEQSLKAIINGNWLGTGPGEGTVKNRLPDSHTDFVFSVASEEFGIIFGCLLILIFGAIVVRALIQAINEHDRFTQLGITGLTLLFGFQAFINIGVAIRLLPAKGMTLPFISYGGSSLISVALSMGMLLALTRKRTDHYRRGVQ